jgi:metal-responsive CopG/Arc/MetJ family transcriptional regulator
MNELANKVKRDMRVGFRLPWHLLTIVDVLCELNEINRSQFLRQALESYKPVKECVDDLASEISPIYEVMDEPERDEDQDCSQWSWPMGGF